MSEPKQDDEAAGGRSDSTEVLAADRRVSRRADIVARLYNNTPNVHDAVEAGNEIQELRALLDPRRWTKETSDKWHRALPDLLAAFMAIRGG